MGRYEELAQYLNAHGIGAIGHDTLVCNKTAISIFLGKKAKL